MTALIDAGYPYELAGLVFYVFFLYMVRHRRGTQYTQRTRVLTIATAIGLVGVVPLNYAHNPTAVALVLLLGLASIASAFADARANR
jgi:hypothetical protein